MALRERMGEGIRRHGPGPRMRHWYHEEGMPGWTRVWHGYPCMHFADFNCPPVYDSRQELDLLREEASELERILGSVRSRIDELETKKKRKKG